MVNDLEGPWQLVPPKVKVGVTVMVAITGAVPVLTAVNAAMSPVPEAGIPMEGSELTQENRVLPPVLVVEKIVGEAVAPLQITCEGGWFTCAFGLTVIVKVVVCPVQVVAA